MKKGRTFAQAVKKF
uniref:Uncharacterized protein n=1 Tax=Arundo donax TaxID=35708 RepID=A0A0A9BSV9_ARUDO